MSNWDFNQKRYCICLKDVDGCVKDTIYEFTTIFESAYIWLDGKQVAWFYGGDTFQTHFKYIDLNERREEIIDNLLKNED